MAHRSHVIAHFENGTQASIYVHDSENLAQLLPEFYAEEKKLEALLSHGDASCLKSTIDSSVFYHRDRGEELFFSEPDGRNDEHHFRDGQWSHL